MEKKPWKKRWKRILIIVGAVAVLLLTVGNIPVYEYVYGFRYDTPEWLKVSVSDYDGLLMEECSFLSDDGQRLEGYRYTKEECDDPKGVVILAHGLGGGGQNAYMYIADYLTSNGFWVFAYDATGNDESEGSGVGGLPQGVIDLSYAIDYVETQPDYEDLPILLFGHSWGAFCCGAVLNVHPEVKAVVMAAGFNESLGMIEAYSTKYIGPLYYAFRPSIRLIEKIKFGAYADYTALSGFANSTARVMILHSTDDTTVSPSYGYDLFYEAYGNSDRFTFIEFTDRGHSCLFLSDEAISYREDFAAIIASLEDDGSFVLNKALWYDPDTELMEKIAAFYESAVR